ncbi:MAG: hypothetical protein HFP77_08150 [Methylococcales symbiont of Iophon sp. n. MRB-2018]|nr:MAG: hypothetical protein HFP77_08150 [Methylococcales symbiont of Iophon sp. n. MRB-2018]KAF3979159.1 MAG: hypothetical protein HFP76_08670 [Methylococcales symbiont of Iophon sp. n. MRB-2018]
MERILYPMQQITLNKRGLVALCLGLTLLVFFYQKNDQEIAVILPNTAFFLWFCFIYYYKSDGCCVFKGWLNKLKQFHTF